MTILAKIGLNREDVLRMLPDRSTPGARANQSVALKPAARQRIIQLKRENRSLSEIAKEIGTSKSTIFRSLQRQ